MSPTTATTTTKKWRRMTDAINSLVASSCGDEKWRLTWCVLIKWGLQITEEVRVKRASRRTSFQHIALSIMDAAQQLFLQSETASLRLAGCEMPDLPSGVFFFLFFLFYFIFFKHGSRQLSASPRWMSCGHISMCIYVVKVQWMTSRCWDFALLALTLIKNLNCFVLITQMH